jgi:DNA replication protein DnaC
MDTLKDAFDKMNDPEWRKAHSAAYVSDAVPESADDAASRIAAARGERFRATLPESLADVPAVEGEPGVLITGPRGTGKTWKATGIGIHNATLGKRVEWLSLPLWLFAFRNHESPVLPSASVVVLDDIGVSKLPEWMTEPLFAVFESCCLNGSSVIATSNLTRAQLADVYGPRIASRLSQLCPRTEVMDGIDRRRGV